MNTTTSLISKYNDSLYNTSMNSPTQGIFPGDADRIMQFVTTIDTHPPELNQPLPCFRLMDENGKLRSGVTIPELDQDTLIRMYTAMVRLQAMDNVFFEAQRQGRISFYMANSGEEGIHIGSAMAFRDDDEIFAQYREAGVLLWRGFDLQSFADQVCFFLICIILTMYFWHNL
jgi:2-oxoisovalerate dehydrogenase E1 component alpha subunit